MFRIKGKIIIMKKKIGCRTGWATAQICTVTKGGAGRGAGQTLGAGGDAQARALGRWARGTARARCAGARRQAGARGGKGRGHDAGARGAPRRQALRRGRTPGARQGRTAGPAAEPAGCALGALRLFLAQFDSVFFRSQIFRHCS